MNLKVYLATIGMSMTHFAKKIDYSVCYISQVTHGKAYPSRRLSKDVYNATNGMVKMITKKEKQLQLEQEKQEAI